MLYLGEINDSQRAAWCPSIEVIDGDPQSRQMELFASDREAPVPLLSSGVSRGVVWGSVLRVAQYRPSGQRVVVHERSIPASAGKPLGDKRLTLL